MKNPIPVVILLLLLTGIYSCKQTSGNEKEEIHPDLTDSYDAVLAMKYGADDYGMKKYVMAFLYRGPNREIDSAKAAQLQMAHLENIGRMADSGKLVLAGPFFGKGDLRGIYIFDVPSIEEAEELTNSDPAI